MNKNKKKNKNLLLTVASLSMRVSKRCLARYSHVKSPHKFTQPQLMTCLILRAYLKTTYRGILEILQTSDSLRSCLGLESLPHYSTLKKFADRAVVSEIVDGIITEILTEIKLPADAIAMDSTGLESTAASGYFQTRTGKRRKQFVKVTVAVTCGSMLAGGLVVGWGPCSDQPAGKELVRRMSSIIEADTLFADAGFDSEWIHEYCRKQWGVKSYIPLARHCDDGSARGYWRSQMLELPPEYGKRWHVESFFSGLKRTMGSALQARNESSLFREAALRVLAYSLRR